jgi:hypothetical protein
MLTEIYLCHAGSLHEIIAPEQGVLELLLSEMATVRAAAGMAGVAGAGAQQVRLVMESRWSQPASECQRL